MTVARSVSDVLAEHVVFEVDCIDRMYLNVYVSSIRPDPLPIPCPSAQNSAIRLRDRRVHARDCNEASFALMFPAVTSR